ncbi:hypothetical protein GGR56DRAFT_550592 [Xylariaceae sp. FL0804]|nr:hypothetical protein GGR56DRAFT_550592 [Xylariaceae sp. FL0804]
MQGRRLEVSRSWNTRYCGVSDTCRTYSKARDGRVGMRAAKDRLPHRGSGLARRPMASSRGQSPDAATRECLKLHCRVSLPLPRPRLVFFFFPSLFCMASFDVSFLGCTGRSALGPENGMDKQGFEGKTTGRLCRPEGQGPGVWPCKRQGTGDQYLRIKLQIRRHFHNVSVCVRLGTAAITKPSRRLVVAPLAGSLGKTADSSTVGPSRPAGLGFRCAAGTESESKGGGGSKSRRGRISPPPTDPPAPATLKGVGDSANTLK